MRKIETHKVNVCNEQLNIEVTDEPGAGGANHRYFISGFHTRTNVSALSHERDETAVAILFQNGTIPECGTNGVTQEALLAIVRDRLESFQAGPFACRENANALHHIEEAMHWLRSRTMKRVARNVEGTHVV